SAMGVLPGGRGNDLARVLGLPRDPVRACAVLSADHERTIDIGLAGKRPFVGIASCGYDSHANRIANGATRLPAQLVYLYGGLGALARWRPADFQVTADGQTRELRGYTVAVANSSTYGNGMRIAPDASMEDGHFDVILISDMARARFLLHLGEVFAGTHTRLREVEVLRAQSVSITASEPFALYADGDVLAELPATLEIDPAAVRVRVPA
ncbi:MAG: diacylglycerol kinase family lipid kinase, partial [Solirubrobacterales bacterium]|nr:diacylglycerol kinase family lipid kinase [Solirubrobacterales bacterium]